jgi:dTMP kinase
VAPEEELRWFLEDRRQHVLEVIEPALGAGRIVLTDRYTLSTVAYQGARGLDWRAILEQSEAEFPVPELVVLLEIEPREGLARVRSRRGGLESVFEDDAFLAGVGRIFDALDRDYVERIPANGSPDEVERAVRACVAGRLSL